MPTKTVLKVSHYHDEVQNIERHPGSKSELTLQDKQIAALVAPFMAVLPVRKLRPQCVTVTIEIES